MTYRAPITQSDLQAYCDGQLSPARRREVEQYLLDHPEAAEQVDDYQNLNDAIHELYDPVLDEPVPAQLAIHPRRQKRRLVSVAAAAAWIGLGAMFGWYMHSTTVSMTQPGPLNLHLVQPAAFAHSIYTAEVKHPVEVPANEQEHLLKWLSKRLHTEITAPDLSAQGYYLVGGRLLPSTDRMAAQLMYERNDGIRVTLYIRHGAWENTLTAFQYDQRGKIALFYWIDGPLGYALAAQLSRNELLKLSETIYHQLN